MVTFSPSQAPSRRKTSNPPVPAEKAGIRKSPGEREWQGVAVGQPPARRPQRRGMAAWRLWWALLRVNRQVRRGPGVIAQRRGQLRQEGPFVFPPPTEGS